MFVFKCYFLGYQLIDKKEKIRLMFSRQIHKKKQNHQYSLSLNQTRCLEIEHLVRCLSILDSLNVLPMHGRSKIRLI